MLLAHDASVGVNSAGQWFWMADIILPIVVSTISGLAVTIGTLASGWFLLRRTDVYSRVSQLWQQRVPSYQKMIYAASDLVTALTLPAVKMEPLKLRHLSLEFMREMNAVTVFCNRPVWLAMAAINVNAGVVLNSIKDARTHKLPQDKYEPLWTALHELQQAVRRELSIDEVDFNKMDWKTMPTADLMNLGMQAPQSKGEEKE